MGIFSKEFEKTQKDGNGHRTEIYADGSKYEGEWENGKPNGKGTMTYAEGKKYVGEFKDGKPDGKGTEFFINGDKYEGEFKAGLRSGQGTKTYECGNKYEGEWENGQPNGQGTSTYVNGNKYVGEFKDRKFNGHGILTLANGDKYEGEFKNDKFHGLGTLTYASGAKYEGVWENSQLNGQGTSTYVNGDKYVGEFKDGIIHGQGIYTSANGEKQEGEFEYGKLKYGYGNRYEEEFKEDKIQDRGASTVMKSQAIQEIRIFISSTFMDLNDERKYLMNKVFPVFAVRLRKRGVDLNIIDLRWGIQPEERVSEKGERLKINKNTLEVCLKEVDRCYPIFIGIIGGRYGWIPESEDVDQETDFYIKYKKKLDGYLSQRKSMTEMEILFGTLEREASPIDYRFYLGEEKIYQDRVENYAAYSKNQQEMYDLFEEAIFKQKSLRDRLIESGKTYGKVFTDASSLGESVMEDMEMLMEHLEQQGEIPTIDLTEDELRLLELKSFEKQKTKGYVEREAEKILDQYLNKLMVRMNQEEIQPLFIVGPSGTGKSSLIANWSKQLDKNSKLKVIKIYMGIQNNISTQNDLIKQLFVNIKKHYGIDREIPGEDELSIHFEQWLSYINEPALIIIDGINQLTDYSSSMSWIPVKMHHPVGIIITSTSTIRAGNQELPANEFRMTGFTMKEKEQFINEYLMKSARSISAEGKATVMDRKDELGNNPLFITVILQELIRSGRKDLYTQDELQRKEFPQDSVLGIIYPLISSQSMEELFVKLYTRYENDYGKQLVEQMLSLIELCRKGIYYKELVDLINEAQGRSLSGIEFQSLFSVIEDKMIKTSGKYAFYHAYIKNAIQKKYKDREIRYREQLATYYSRIVRKQLEENDLHHAEELTYQLAMLERWEDLFETISNPKVLYWMLSYYKNDISGYFKYFKAKGYDFSTFYEKVKDKIKTDVYLNNMVGLLFLLNGENELSIKLFEERGSEIAQKYGEEDPDLWIIWSNLAKAYIGKGEWDKAIGLLQKVAEKRENKYGEEDLDLWIMWRYLAEAYLSKGELDKAICLLQKVAVKEENKYGEEYPDLWITWNSLAEAYRLKKEFDEAISLLQKVVAKRESKYGEDDPGLLTIWNNLAIDYLEKGEWDKAIGLLQKVAEKRENKYGEEFPGLWRTWENLADAYGAKGELDKAIELLQKVTEKQEKKYGEEYPDLWKAWTSLAHFYKAKGEFDKFIGLFERVAAKEENKYGDEYPDLWATWSHIAEAYRVKGEFDNAISLLQKTAEKIEGKYGEDYPDLWTIWSNLAMAYLGKGEWDKAIELFERAAAKEEKKYGEEYPVLWEIWNRLAEAYWVKGEFDEAIRLLQKTAVKEENKYGKDDPVLWTVWSSLAEAYRVKGEFDKAIILLQKTAENIEGKYGEDHPDLLTIWSNLAVIYEAKGEYDKATALLHKVKRKTNK